MLVPIRMLAYALVSAFNSILAPGSAVEAMQMAMVTPVMVFGLWLAIRSIDVPVDERSSDRDAFPTGRRGQSATEGAPF